MSVRCEARRARLLPAAPIRRACGNPSSKEIRVAFRPAILEESPTLLRDLYPAQVQAGDEDLLFRMRRPPHNFAERIGHEGTAPKSKIAFAADAIDSRHKNAIEGRVSTHRVLPAARRKGFVPAQLLKPAYC